MTQSFPGRVTSSKNRKINTPKVEQLLAESFELEVPTVTFNFTTAYAKLGLNGA